MKSKKITKILKLKESESREEIIKDVCLSIS